jgi:hypothetical protein
MGGARRRGHPARREMDTTSVAFVYHLCSRDMRGTTLYPLNGLKDRFPDVYARERKKYEGRESVLDWVVPGLGVPWADTVNLSALDPRLLVAARVELGVPFSRLLERPLARIPLERLTALPAVVYNSATHWINSSPGEDVPLTPPHTEFFPFDPSAYSEPREVPQLHLDYLLRQKARGQLALGFVFVRHVLVAGPVDLSGIDFIDMEPPPRAAE